jgi:hypothetical protein
MSYAPAARPGPPLLGSQSPTYRSVPPRVDTRGHDAAELVSIGGLVLDEWQFLVLCDSLGIADSGKWSALECGLIVPRQNGKSAILEARMLAGVLLFGEQLVTYTAHLFDTAMEMFLRFEELLHSAPEFTAELVGKSSSHGLEGFRFRNGSRVRFKTRTKGGGRGFSGDCVILDESMKGLGPHEMSALMPTMSARMDTTEHGPQLWYAGSAGNTDSEQQARVVARGRAGGDPALAYHEWCLEETDELYDPASWAKANPAYGRRIDPALVLTESVSMDRVSFARERGGVGTYPLAEGADTPIPQADWLRAQDRQSRITGALVFALDVAWDRSAAAIAVAGRRADGAAHIEVIDHRPGTRWVAERIAELAAKWPSPVGPIVDMRGPAGSLEPEFVDAGVRMSTLAVREIPASYGAIYDAVTARPPAVRHRGQPVLDEALQHARLRRVAGAQAWDRRGSDASPIIAVTFALHGLLSYGNRTPGLALAVPADHITHTQQLSHTGF